MTVLSVDFDSEDAGGSATAASLYPLLSDGFEWMLVGSIQRNAVASAYENRTIKMEVDLYSEEMDAVLTLDVNMNGITRYPVGPFDPSADFAITGPLLSMKADIIYGFQCVSSDLLCSVHVAIEAEGGRKLNDVCICIISPFFCLATL